MATNANSQLYALVDCNNYFASVERVFQPKLANKPVVVLSNNDGCVVARSQEVKDLGVKMSTPWHQMQDLVRQHGIVGMSSNYTLYGDMSNRVMAILRTYSPNVEAYSIDEAFLSLNGLGGLWNSPSEMGQAIRRQVRQWVSIQVSVGAGQTKTLAKLGSYVSKKLPLFDGVCDFSTMSDARASWLMQRIGVEEVWGVGQRTAARLQDMGIYTVMELKEAPLSHIRAQFGVVMERTCLELRGTSVLALEEVPPARKQIVSSKSFGAAVTTIQDLGQAVTAYAARAAEKLRTQGSVCGAIHVFVHTNFFRQQDRQYSNGVTIPLAVPTADNRILVGAALQGLESIFREGYNYKKAGVMLLDLSSSSVKQGTLFDSSHPPAKAERAMAAMDSINARFGRDSLQLASAGIVHRWAMKAGNRSPRYTTRWDELPIAHAR